MIRVAILVDGGYYRKRVQHLVGKKTPEERANELEEYCKHHINGAASEGEHYLYRIFYYDCPPLDKVVFHPLGAHQVNFKNSETYTWTIEFLNALKRKRKFALRMGKLSTRSAEFRIKHSVTKKLLSGSIQLQDLQDNDFEIDFEQKGVDMRIGLDIASLAHKRQVDQIVLIAGDSDFVPAAKHARREGIDFILDPMGQRVNDDLFEHIDGMRSYWKRLKPVDVEEKA